MADLEIGAKIRKYRTEKGFSMKTLAEKVNITPSMLSQIEHDQANPSINTLKGGPSLLLGDNLSPH